MADITLLSNPMTTQDDIIIGGASGAATRLAKGTDGQVLTVDPTTHHLVWATPTGGGGAVTGHGWILKRSSGNVAITPTNTYVPIGFTAEDQDTDGYHDPVTNNSRATIPTGLGGWYVVFGQFYNDSAHVMDAAILVNGAPVPVWREPTASAGFTGPMGVAGIIHVADADYVELAARDVTGTCNVVFDSSILPTFRGVFVGS